MKRWKIVGRKLRQIREAVSEMIKSQFLRLESSTGNSTSDKVLNYEAARVAADACASKVGGRSIS